MRMPDFIRSERFEMFNKSVYMESYIKTLIWKWLQWLGYYCYFSTYVYQEQYNAYSKVENFVDGFLSMSI